MKKTCSYQVLFQVFRFKPRPKISLQMQALQRRDEHYVKFHANVCLTFSKQIVLNSQSIQKNIPSLQENFFHEKELVTRLREGDEVAFESLYHIYSKRLLGFLIKSVKSETIASELLQDTFIKIWKNRENIDAAQSFRSYLFRISENVVFDFFRKAARDKALQDTLIRNACEEYSHVEEDFCVKEREQILSDLVNLLPPKRRQVFQLIKMEERSYSEVSNSLSISPSTISDHIVKATKFIREHMEDAKVVALYITILFILS